MATKNNNYNQILVNHLPNMIETTIEFFIEWTEWCENEVQIKLLTFEKESQYKTLELKNKTWNVKFI